MVVCVVLNGFCLNMNPNLLKMMDIPVTITQNQATNESKIFSWYVACNASIEL